MKVKGIGGPLEYPTHEYLKERFIYNDKDLIWRNGRCRGKVVGCIKNDNASMKYYYTILRLNNKRVNFYIHRLIWKWKLGYFPEYLIEHIDRNGLNNSWDNLREVTPSCSMKNRKIGTNNKSGVTGVCYTKKTNNWRANIYINKKQVILGQFETKEEAIAVRKEAEKEHGYITD